MFKLKLQISVLVFLITCCNFPVFSQTEYSLLLKGIDKDSSAIVTVTGIQTQFSSRTTCTEYINKLPALLQAKGYVTASLDKIDYDSAFATIVLFLGDVYRWAGLKTSNSDSTLLRAVGWSEKVFTENPLDDKLISGWQEKILNYLENNGHPFARVYIDSLKVNDGDVSGKLNIDRGPLYKIDSIRVYGNAKISNLYLQRYLDLPNGSFYNKEKLSNIGKKIRELTYIEEEQPANLSLLGTGSVLNLYLKQKRSSQVNILVGLLPNNDQLSSKKLLLTGEANILLKNALGAGEIIGLNWQQLQVKSPRLHVLFNYPYLFRSPLGLDFTFDIFRKDSSFVNINMQLGGKYVLNNNQSSKIFIQRFQTYISSGGINELQIISTRRLPDIGDVNSFNIGVDYDFNNTDYRLNPRKGNEINIITSIGTKKIKKNNEILELKDPGDPGFDFAQLYDTVKLKTFQFRGRLTVSKYIPLGKQRSTLKTVLNAGILQSGNIFRNELFQLGGYKLLRGFDEESQYLSHFSIATIEYRYLVGQNSFFYVLADGGWGRNNSNGNKIDYTYFGTGLGLAFETKAGIFNLAWAVGKRNDTELNLRQSKIHFGFVNYF